MCFTDGAQARGRNFGRRRIGHPRRSKTAKLVPLWGITSFGFIHEQYVRRPSIHRSCFRWLYGIFLIDFLTRVVHSGKELYKQFLSVSGTNLNPSQGRDLGVGIDPDVEIAHGDVKLPHLECLCLHLGDHTRDSNEVRHVSTLITAVSHVRPCT